MLKETSITGGHMWSPLAPKLSLKEKAKAFFRYGYDFYRECFSLTFNWADEFMQIVCSLPSKTKLFFIT